ncbi:hypothetical protein [Ideonella paludis]|uniref:Uncharacterized protein n=1 Tax=Ideonella paludis TaxID=1233411 RepID=A0ABS5E090_9BURK|nr:hypothetical protein [Ideonella paludis]MBQ0936808.1 hypothetical protein [Ideonella paludis]
MKTAIRALGFTLFVVGSSAAFEAHAVQTAYFNVGTAYLVDTNAKTKAAQVATSLGARSGRYTDSGTQRTINLTTPLSYEVFGDWTDCQVQQAWRRDIQTLTLKRLSGSAKKGQTAVVQSGVDVEIAGCNVGQVTPFGSPSDAGVTLSHLALSERPSMADVVPGTKWAGVHEDPYTPQEFFPGTMAADVVTWQSSGVLRFEKSGRSVPAAVNAEGWWALSLPGGERRYTRLSRDKATGAEVWLMGDFNGSQFTWASAWWVSPYRPSRGFGDVAAASRSWAHGLIPTEYFRNMYTDFSGDVYSYGGPDFGWTRQAGWTWQFSGLNINHSLETASMSRARPWEPVRRVGTAQWVMEEYRITSKIDGHILLSMPRRLMHYIDTGPAVKPTQAGATSLMRQSKEKEPAMAPEGLRLKALARDAVGGQVR